MYLPNERRLAPCRAVRCAAQNAPATRAARTRQAERHRERATSQRQHEQSSAAEADRTATKSKHRNVNAYSNAKRQNESDTYRNSERKSVFFGRVATLDDERLRVQNAFAVTIFDRHQKADLVAVTFSIKLKIGSDRQFNAKN